MNVEKVKEWLASSTDTYRAPLTVEYSVPYPRLFLNPPAAFPTADLRASLYDGIRARCWK